MMRLELLLLFCSAVIRIIIEQALHSLAIVDEYVVVVVPIGMSRLFVRRLAFLSLLLFIFPAVAWSDSKVLLIHSYHENLKWTQDISQGIHEGLGAGYVVTTHYMDTKRIAPEKFTDAAETAYEAFRQRKPDLVILCDDNALRLLGQRVSATTPVVFCGINGDIRADYPWVVGAANVTGVMERPLIKRAIADFMKQTNTYYKKVLILLGDSPTARAFHRYDLWNKSNLHINKSTMAYVVRTADLNDWKTAVTQSGSDGYDLLLVAGFAAMRDSNGVHVSLEHLSRWVHSHSPIDTMTVHEQAVGENQLMAGMVVSGQIMGQDTAKLVKTVLNSPVNRGKVPILTQKMGRFIYSRSGLAERNIKPPVADGERIILIP